jgi:hypothetical protein
MKAKTNSDSVQNICSVNSFTAINATGRWFMQNSRVGIRKVGTNRILTPIVIDLLLIREVPHSIPVKRRSGASGVAETLWSPQIQQSNILLSGADDSATITKCLLPNRTEDMRFSQW